MGRKKTATKRKKEVYSIILHSGHEGITTVNIAKRLNLKAYNIKYPVRSLIANNDIYSRASFELKPNGDPDARGKRYYATVYNESLPLNSDQLAIINALRINRQIKEASK